MEWKYGVYITATAQYIQNVPLNLSHDVKGHTTRQVNTVKTSINQSRIKLKLDISTQLKAPAK